MKPIALFLLSLLLAACASATGSAIPTPTVPLVAEIEATDTPAITPTVGPTFTNPVYTGDFPDPFVLRVGDAYYAYATNAGGSNVQTVRLSLDFAEARFVGDAMPRLPEWAAWHQGLTWAPSVLPRGDGYVLYYTARYREAGRQCVSRGAGDSPEGPFVDDLPVPFICQTDLGGSIDPSPFVDGDGAAYLLWKNDGNCCNIFTGIFIQQLSDDGLTLVGEPVELIRKDQLWEHPLVEGPSMLKHDGRYYLFYSGNWWESLDYAVGYAVCETVFGPCVKPQKAPIFARSTTVMGPGGQEFFTDPDGDLWMAYHGWTAPNVGYPGGSRSLRVDRITFDNGVPVITGPTDSPQPLP